MAGNYSTSCLDPKEAFSSIEYLFGCFQTLGEPDGHKAYTTNPNTSFGGMIEDCINQYCQNPDPDLQGCSKSVIWDSPTTYSCFASPSWGFYAGNCASLNRETNEDVSGPGIMVAYLMQLLIVFLIWLILRLIQFIPWCAKYFSGKKNQQMAEDAKQMNLYKHAPIVKSILVDFQESQCYFVLSVQAAMLVAVSGDSSVLGATSVSQIWANFAQVVSMSGGYLPSLTFGLWLLRRSRLDSAYMLAWSLAAIIFTAFTIFSNIPHEPNVAGINPISNLGDLDKCGHNPPPLIYCSDEYYELYSLSRVFSAVCLMICGVMLLQKSSPYLEKSLSNYPAFSRISHAMKRVVKYRAFRVISKVWTPFAEMFLLSVNVFSITINIFQVGGDWSFGQIIAVTIWVPIFTKYIYWASFGTPSYSAIRFSEPFHIVEMESKKDPSTESEESQTHEILPSNGTMELRPTPARTFTWS